MPAKIVWRDEARADLIATTRYIAEHNPSAARSYASDLDLAVRGFADFPMQGRP
jgi:plasmid stabilization system protein ParE